jgi:hypothetical protein
MSRIAALSILYFCWSRLAHIARFQNNYFHIFFNLSLCYLHTIQFLDFLTRYLWLCDSWNASPPINLTITYTDVLLAAWNFVMSCTYLYSSSASFAVSYLLMPFTYRYSTFVHVQWMVQIWKMTSKAVSFGSTVQFSTPSLLNYKSLWIFWYIHFAMYLNTIICLDT